MDKEKFEFIFRHTNEAILLIELKGKKIGRVLEANEAAVRLLGKSREDLVGHVPAELASDEVMGQNGSMVREAVEKGFTRFERRVELAEGEPMWLEVTAHSFVSTGEQLLVAILSDITSGKRTREALRESERLHRMLIESAEDRIVLFNEDGSVILKSPSYYTALGYTLEEFDRLGTEKIVHPDDWVRLQKERDQLFERGTSAHEYRVRHKEGHYLHMASRNVLIPVEPGQKRMILSISRDITERKRAMQELDEARKKAEESDRLKSAFLANMSHEIRTPMNSIVGFSHLLLKPGLSDATRADYIGKIIRNSDQLLALISDIIDLAKIESGQLPILYGRKELGEFMSDMARYARDELDRLGKESIRVEKRTDNGRCEMETDVVRMAQVMKNLINNAVKFTSDGFIRIGCRLSEDEKNILFSVKDTGIGIPESQIRVIFDQFRQVDSSDTRKYGGTGLGLAICRNLVGLMGGKITVESEDGSGTMFQVELPRTAAGSGI